MSAIEFMQRAPETERLRQSVYAGHLLVIRGCPPVRRMAEYFASELRRAFAPHDPPVAQFAMAADEWAARAGELRARYKRDPRARELMTELFDHLGLGVERTAADVVNLRCQPHADAPGTDPRHTLGAHRDTWSSNVYQQINWWTPVFPIDVGRTITFFPNYWSEAIDNTSAGWDLAATRAEFRAARSDGREPALPAIPEPSQPVATTHSLPIVIEPGDILVFSGAHLHASVPNASGAARFSLELRSIDVADAEAGVGAPNVDGAAPGVAWGWFRRLDTGERLPES